MEPPAHNDGTTANEIADFIVNARHDFVPSWLLGRERAELRSDLIESRESQTDPSRCFCFVFRKIDEELPLSSLVCDEMHSLGAEE